MKVDREKRHRRILQFYLQNFRLKSPFRIIMDYEFIEHLVNRKLGMVRELFPKLFGEKAYPMVTECMVQAAKEDPNSDHNVVKLMSSFERAPCGHQTGVRSAEDCLRECFAEPRYCLAGRCKWTNVLVLRAPSENSKLAVENEMEGKRAHADDLERELTQKALQEEKRERVERNKEKTSKIAYQLRFHRKPVAKGPNPMSMRKPMSQEDRAKKRSMRNPFMQFGGASAMKGESDDPFDDPEFISRSKLRKKRKRALESSLKAEERALELQSGGTETKEKTNSVPSPEPSNPDDPAPTPKFRKRRKPKASSTPKETDQTHSIREEQRLRDITAEAAVSPL